MMEDDGLKGLGVTIVTLRSLIKRQDEDMEKSVKALSRHFDEIRKNMDLVLDNPSNLNHTTGLLTGWDAAKWDIHVIQRAAQAKIDLERGLAVLIKEAQSDQEQA